MKNQSLNLLALSFITILLAMSCAEKQMTPLQLANKVLQEYEQKTSLSYDINYQIKFFSETTDTTKINANVDLIRVENDSLFGGYIWIDAADSISRYYDTKALYIIEHKNAKITKYPKSKSFMLTSRVVNEAYRVYFLNPTRLIDGINDTTNIATLSEDNIGGNSVWKFSYDYGDKEDRNNSWKNIWIDKENSIVHKINFSADLKGENQYNQWDLYNLSFNSVTIEDLDSRLQNLIDKYDMTEDEESEEPELMTLPVGTELPNLDAVTYPDKSAVKLHNYRNKLTLYDFWFMDCPSCIKAIPQLNELHNKYKEMGLTIVGVNPINYNEKDLKRMPNFLEHVKIDYPIILMDRTESEELQVPIYPTYFLVDENSRIIHTHMGFDEASIDLMEIDINEYLSN